MPRGLIEDVLMCAIPLDGGQELIGKASIGSILMVCFAKDEEEKT